MNAVVIGLGFGDEGKGITTDFLVRQLLKTGSVIVVRFSGGQQAGHTVVSNDGVSHVFSNFGSGTLAGAPTYWSKFCTVDPVGIIREFNVLMEKGVRPLLYIDEECPVTTPYDKIDNQLRDRANGTCGTGFGSTLRREEHLYSLKAGDLKYPSILAMKLDQIRKYYESINPEISKIADAHFTDFIEACANLRFTTSSFVIQKSFPYHKHIVFEGSQGLMLDMNHGIFPHVTRSKTDTTNVPEILNGEDFEVYLVTRCYQTRHGNGPMTNEQLPLKLKNTEKETNQLNEFQGTFRKSILDLDLLNYVIQKDPRLCEGNHRVNLVVTCLDQLEEYSYTKDGSLVTFQSPMDFVKLLSTQLELPLNAVYYSESPDSKNMQKLPLNNVVYVESPESKNT